LYGLLRKTKLARPDAAEEAARRVREGVVPILQEQRGFLLHLGFISEACEAVGVSLFSGEAEGRAALRYVGDWAAANMRDLTTGEPEVRSGAVIHHRSAAAGLIGADKALFVTVREYNGAGPAEETASIVSERVLPVIERQPGFRRVWGFRDDRAPEHAASISLWASRGAAFAAHGRVLKVITGLREVFPTPPRTTAGAARIIAAPISG
jgi:hypothetical protein